MTAVLKTYNRFEEDLIQIQNFREPESLSPIKTIDAYVDPIEYHYMDLNPIDSLPIHQPYTRKIMTDITAKINIEQLFDVDFIVIELDRLDDIFLNYEENSYYFRLVKQLVRIEAPYYYDEGIIPNPNINYYRFRTLANAIQATDSDITYAQFAIKFSYKFHSQYISHRSQHKISGEYEIRYNDILKKLWELPYSTSFMTKFLEFPPVNISIEDTYKGIVSKFVTMRNRTRETQYFTVVALRPFLDRDIRSVVRSYVL